MATLQSQHATRQSFWPACMMAVAGVSMLANVYLYHHGVSLPVHSLYSTRVSAEANPAPSATPQQPLAPSVDPATGPWTYDFSNLPSGRLPATFWKFEEGTHVADYNHEAQAYTARMENVRIRDGVLQIEARKEALHGRQYTSARVNTLGSFSFTYGTIEVDMKLPRGKGTWPAAWLMPRDNIYNPDNYGISQTDPYRWAMNGEIDFAEAIGSIPGENIPAAHSINRLRSGTVYTPAKVSDPYTTYHRYGLIKTSDSLTYTIDGKPYASRVKTSDSPLDWPYNQPYYLILNLAIGGKWAGAQGIDDSSAPWLLQVRSISYKPF